ncbi:Uncharacterised protein [Mycobacteroides abscessus subsp. abscessus]|nr:Uncharacterised protein [Mycobacteroides abscessus subsp. abscessus]SHP67853.1 Uncharacterised protein [Mycobacteroides abscessus subsp. abscessus]SHY38943.1 Uncharacterised protein [Mycobacteroides abscessus subsp. abscessus]SKD94326.1 Uncharacterised protein [Mycobacteroides abscessus subsp. abscessus]
MFASMVTESAALPASRGVGLVVATSRLASLPLPARESSTYRPMRCLVLFATSATTEAEVRADQIPAESSTTSTWRSGTIDRHFGGSPS